MRNWIVIIMVFLGASSFAQVSITAGPSMLLGTVSAAKPWAGFHFGLEIPRDDQVTIYGRFTHHFGQLSSDSTPVLLSPIDPLTNFNYPIISSRASMNYNILEGGTRYYLGNGFDFGWAAYGGSNVMIVFSRIKNRYDDYDESLYKIDPIQNPDKGTIFGLGVGLGGGVKYTFPRFGTLYTDLNINYMLLGTTSTPQPDGSLYSPLLFNFNIGYRKDIIWQ
ncbi:MAG: hypothetical protein COA33_008620 [Fluviicola sp.]|nr:hypothetical protein [Fluviicola sp.]